MIFGIEGLEARRLLSFPLGIGSTDSDVGNSVAADREGNVLVAGSYAGTTDFDLGGGVAQLSGSGGFVAKYTADGTFVWARRFSGATPAKLATDRNNNVYVAGSFSGTVDFDPRGAVQEASSAGGTDAFVVTLTKSGNLVRVATFGGKADDTGDGLAVSTDGQVYVGGTFAGRADFDPSASGRTSIGNSGGTDGYLVALDDAGVFRWAGSFAGPNDEHLSDVALDDGGNVLASGGYEGTTDFDPLNGTALNGVAGQPEGYALKWDNTGAFVWFAGYGGTGTTYGTSIAADRNGNVYTIGNFNHTVDLDPSLSTFSVSAPKSGRVFVSKLDSSGTMVWGKAIGGSTANDFGPGEVSVDRHDDVTVTGRFAGTQDFDPDGGTQNLTSSGDDDVFVSKLDSNGAFVFAKSLGGTTRDLVRGSTLDRDGNILTTGAFTGTADFDPSGSTLDLTSNGSDDIFVSKLDENGLVV